jgi:hypothetical protein
MARIENERVVETTLEARGAERGPTVRNVLVYSLFFAVIALAGVHFAFFN